MVNEQIAELSREVETLLRQKYKVQPSQAHLFSLRMCGLNIEEIAREVEIKPDSVGKMIDRARKHMNFTTIYQAAYEIGRQIG